jgi:hypothetical protein
VGRTCQAVVMIVCSIATKARAYDLRKARRRVTVKLEVSFTAHSYSLTFAFRIRSTIPPGPTYD